jgi:hypothetical protein
MGPNGDNSEADLQLMRVPLPRPVTGLLEQPLGGGGVGDLGPLRGWQP